MDSSTKFPDEIDDRVYFQDVDLEHIEASKSYLQYYDLGDYDNAVNALQVGNVQYFGADILNLFENRLQAIEEYLGSTDDPVVLTAYQQNEPVVTSSMDVGFTWLAY